MRLKHGALALGAWVLLAASPRADDKAPAAYDLVIRGGRVMDTESGLDAVRDVGRGQVRRDVAPGRAVRAPVR
jgi:hypothetical protein